MKKLTLGMLFLLFSHFLYSQWELLPYPTETYTIGGLDFVTESTGFFIGGTNPPEEGPVTLLLFKTTDYGESWEVIWEIELGSESEGGIKVYDIDFVSENIGFLSVIYFPGWEPTVLKTTDGGYIWDIVQTAPLSMWDYPYGQIAFQDEMIGYGNGYGALWGPSAASYTHDGGLTWTQLGPNRGSPDIWISGECEAWVVSKYSIDCGESWSELPTSYNGISRMWSSISVEGSSILRGGMGLVQGGVTFNTGALGVSHDLGETWQVNDFMQTSVISEVHLENQLEGYITTGGQFPIAILKTWDGGQSWHKQEYPQFNSFGNTTGGSQLSCPSPGVCYWAGSTNILRTFNGGGPSTGLADYTVSTIEAVKPEFVAELFPNPANSLLNVSFSQSLTNSATLTVADITGREVAKQQVVAGVQQAEVDVRALPAGVYVLRVAGSGVDVVRRFVRE